MKTEMNVAKLASSVSDIKPCIITAKDAKIAKKFL